MTFCPCAVGLTGAEVREALDRVQSVVWRSYQVLAFDGAGDLLAVVGVGWFRQPVAGLLVRDGEPIDPDSWAVALKAERTHGAVRLPTAWAVASWGPVFNGAAPVEVSAWNRNGEVRSGHLSAPAAKPWGVHPSPVAVFAGALLAGQDGATWEGVEGAADA